MQFLCVISLSAVIIYCKFCNIYGPNVMKEGVICRCCIFKDGQIDVHNEVRSEQLPIVSDVFMQEIDKKVHNVRHFMISEFLYTF